MMNTLTRHLDTPDLVHQQVGALDCRGAAEVGHGLGCAGSEWPLTPASAALLHLSL